MATPGVTGGGLLVGRWYLEDSQRPGSPQTTPQNDCAWTGWEPGRGQNNKALAVPPRVALQMVAVAVASRCPLQVVRLILPLALPGPGRPSFPLLFYIRLDLSL